MEIHFNETAVQALRELGQNTRTSLTTLENAYNALFDEWNKYKNDLPEHQQFIGKMITEIQQFIEDSKTSVNNAATFVEARAEELAKAIAETPN